MEVPEAEVAAASTSSPLRTRRDTYRTLCSVFGGETTTPTSPGWTPPPLPALSSRTLERADRQQRRQKQQQQQSVTPTRRKNRVLLPVNIGPEMPLPLLPTLPPRQEANRATSVPSCDTTFSAMYPAVFCTPATPLRPQPVLVLAENEQEDRALELRHRRQLWEARRSVNWHGMPPEVWIRIMEFVDAPQGDTMIKLSQLSRAWHRTWMNPRMWQNSAMFSQSEDARAMTEGNALQLYKNHRLRETHGSSHDTSESCFSCWSLKWSFQWGLGIVCPSLIFLWIVLLLIQGIKPLVPYTLIFLPLVVVSIYWLENVPPLFIAIALWLPDCSCSLCRLSTILWTQLPFLFVKDVLDAVMIVAQNLNLCVLGLVGVQRCLIS